MTPKKKKKIPSINSEEIEAIFMQNGSQIILYRMTIRIIKGDLFSLWQ